MPVQGLQRQHGPTHTHMLAAQTEPLRAKALAFSSVAGARGVQERSVDTDIVAAEVAPQVCSGACRSPLLARSAAGPTVL